MTKRLIKFSVLAGLLLVVLLCGTFINPPRAKAYDYTDYLMDDSTFRNFVTMTPSDIQTFLQNEGSGLANFSDVENCGSTSGPNYSYYATYYSCGSTESASQIIYDASQAYGINPQVILATMQKEQSLITTPNPTASQLDYAMGYGCPDSGSCGYAGFFNQVDNGTWQFRADMELGSGNSWWGYGPSSYPCNGATRYYSEALKTGNTVTFYDDYGNAYATFTLPNMSTSSLYCYTPHVYPGSSQEYYSGSYWFVYYFSLWFGSSSAPYAFKSSSSDTVYISVEGYKVSVPAMGMLQDYGVSPQAIHILSQTQVDNIPTPSVSSNGISPTLSSIIKSPSDTDADGAAAYFVSAGKKYQIQSMTQFSDFGFNTSNISYLPLSFIQAFPGTSFLSNYIVTPTSSVFQVSSDVKRIIFDYATFQSQDPSGVVSYVSYYGASQVPSGNPLADSNILVKSPGSDEIYLFTNNTYYAVPTYDAYNCWGFASTLHVSVYTAAYSDYIAAISPTASLSCTINDGSGNNYLLSKTTKYPIPSTYGIPNGPTADSNLLAIINQLPTGGNLTQYIRGVVSPVVWYIDSGNKRQVPTYSDYVLLGVTPSELTYVDDSALSAIPSSGIKLGTGQPVKTSGSTSVYTVSGDTRVLYSRSDDFLAYGNSWSNIETYSSTDLDTYYPYQNINVSPYFYYKTSNAVYFADPNGCYLLDSSLLTDFGQSQSTIEANQPYGIEIFPNFKISSCVSGSQYVKDPDNAAVYLLQNGQKHQFADWSSLVNYSGQQNPYIINLSTDNLANFPTGSSISD